MIFTAGEFGLLLVIGVAAVIVGVKEARVVRRKTGDNSWLMKLLSFES